MNRAVSVVAVVVPARDEHELLPACLAGVEAAVRRLPVPVLTVVVADHCTDDTALVAAAAGVRVVRCEGHPDHGVGAARAAGCAHALETLGSVPPQRVWLAHTDADSVVPADWLVVQLQAAADGADAVVGRVTLAGADASARHERWQAAYDRAAGEPGRRAHVHGANLGVRADAYLAAGGFAPVPAHEDAGLVERLLALGRRVEGGGAQPVVTSARLQARAPAGLAADLRTLL